MRGKTNIGGGGIAINATPQQKTIKGGNIIAGDFVEYYSEPEYLDQTTRINFIFDFGDYLIARPGAGSYITAFKDGEQVDSYVGYNCSIVDKCGDFIIFYDAVQGIIGVLSIVNDRFNLVSTLSVTALYDGNNPIIIAGGGGKICILKGNTSSPYYPTIIVCDISNSGILSNAHTTNPQEAHRIMFSAQFYNGYFYVVMTNSSDYNYYLYKLEISAQNEVTIGPKIGNSMNLSSGSPRIVYKKNEMLGYAYHDGSSSSYNTPNDGYLVLINVTTGNAILKKIANYGEVLSIISDGYIITTKRILQSSSYYTRWFVLCRFNENTFEITELDAVEVESITKMLSLTLAGVKNNIIYVQYKDDYSSPNNLYLFEIVNGNTVQNLSDHQYVKPYQDGGNPIGVAKDSGAINDVIDVYIPVASS